MLVKKHKGMYVFTQSEIVLKPVRFQIRNNTSNDLPTSKECRLHTISDSIIRQNRLHLNYRNTSKARGIPPKRRGKKLRGICMKELMLG